MKITKKIVAFFWVIVLICANFNIAITQEVSAATGKIGTMDFLKANGKVLKNSYGSGDTVYLRGTNAGGYMLQEFWMTPTSYSTNADCQMDILNVLTSRFGSSAARTLVQTYEANYWTESDFDKCASMGINCIRLPLWYRNFVDENNNWYNDAFDRVDWFVEQAGKRGIYVIIDMHGAYGSQNGSDHSGVEGGGNKQGASEFFFGSNAASNQEKYYQMWEKIAAHFNGNPIVAGYDLLNEPFNEYRYSSGYSDDYLHSLLWGVYDKAYDRIRAIDSDHVIIMEATWESWDLPNPSNYGWENVMYEYHNYTYSDYDNASGTQISNMQTKINNIFSSNYNVPSYMGEFSYFNNISAWEAGLQLLNDNGLNWTSWSYKCVSEYGNWGLMNQSVSSVNVDTDSYDTILSKWSNVGSSYENTNLVNAFKKYTPGTVADKNSTALAEGKYYLDCNSKIVCAEDEGKSPLAANRDSYSGAWETFHVVNNDDGTISLKSDINGKYVCAVIDENCQLLARSSSISLWEKFYLIHIQDNQYGLRAVANGKYVKADFDDTSINGQLKAVSDSVAGAWEAFYFNKVSDETTQATTTAAPTTTAQETTKTFNAFSIIEAEQFTSKQGGVIDTNSSASGGYNIGGVTNGVYMAYENVNFSENAGAIQFCYSSPTATALGNAEIYVDSFSNKVGTVVLTNNASSWQQYGTLTANLDSTISAGNHTIYVKYVTTGSYAYVANVDYFKFIKASEVVTEAPTTQAATTATPTTEAPTTTAPSGQQPIEVIGFVIQNTEGNKVTFVWGQNQEQMNLGQKYNVYIDGNLYQTYDGAQSVTYTFATSGQHTITIKAVLNGVESTGVSETVSIQQEETTTADSSKIVISDKVCIEGYQISQYNWGFRTVSSVEPEINGKSVVEYGNIYAILLGDTSADDLYVGSSSKYVVSYKATELGITDIKYSDSDTAINYIRTMSDNGTTKDAFQQRYMIRAYAKLSDGSYVYSNACEYSIFDVAKAVYDNGMMPNVTAHNYVYENILKVVDSNYSEVDYNWTNAVVKP